MLNSVRTWNGNPNGPLLKYALGLRCSYRVLQRIVPKVRDVFAEIPYTRFSYAINRHARYLVFFFFLINPIHKRAIHELETRGEPRRGINPFFFLFFFCGWEEKRSSSSIFPIKKKKEKGILRTTGVPASPLRPFSQCTRFEHRQSRSPSLQRGKSSCLGPLDLRNRSLGDFSCLFERGNSG